MKKLVLARWDTIHRSIRDVKLALLHGSSGEYLQAQFHSQYLFSVAYRPFGSSGFFEEKKRCLELLLSRETWASVPEFMDSWERIREELGLDSAQSASDVWEALSSMSGFQNKQSLPKLSRWFSWNASVEEKMPEWTALKVILAYNFRNENLNPDDAYAKRMLDEMARESTDQSSMRKEFSKLKARLGGGLRLCYYLMSDRLYMMVQVISLCTRPIWDWYSSTIEDIKTPADQIQKLAALQTHWREEPHLVELVKIPMNRDQQLLKLLRRSEFEDTPSKVQELSLLLLKYRLWSISKAAAPPDCYAGILMEDPVLQQAWNIALFLTCFATDELVHE